jgi:hypothetical protein
MCQYCYAVCTLSNYFPAHFNSQHEGKGEELYKLFLLTSYLYYITVTVTSKDMCFPFTIAVTYLCTFAEEVALVLVIVCVLLKYK